MSPSQQYQRKCLRIGRSLLAGLPARLPAQVVADRLGISMQMVIVIECLAAYKIMMRVKAAIQHEDKE